MVNLRPLQSSDGLDDVLGLRLDHGLGVVEAAVVEEGPDLAGEKIEQQFSGQGGEVDFQLVAEVGAQPNGDVGALRTAELNRLHLNPPPPAPLPPASMPPRRLRDRTGSSPGRGSGLPAPWGC